MIIGQIAIWIRELVRMVCQNNELEILAGHVDTSVGSSITASVSKQVGAVYQRSYIEKTTNEI